MSLWLIDLAFGLTCILAGCTMGWWLRSRRIRPTVAPARPQTTAQNALRNLHQVTESVQHCIQQHTECIQAIEDELCESASHDPAVLTAAAATIKNASQQVCSEFSNISENLAQQTEVISSNLDYNRTLLLTSLSLDRQKQQYEKVLESLQLLAVEVGRDVDGCRNKIQSISQQIDLDNHQESDLSHAISQMLSASDVMQEKIVSAEQTLSDQAQRVEMQAVLGHTDALTGLPNHLAFEDEVSKRFLETHSKRRPFAIMTIKLDNFEQINKQYGRVGGNVVLQAVARQIKNSLRGDDATARTRGATFSLVLPDTTLAQALPAARRMCKEIEDARFSHGRRSLQVTASLGLSQLLGGDEQQHVEQRSHQAASTAQQSGGNCTYYHDGREVLPAQDLQQGISKFKDEIKAPPKLSAIQNTNRDEDSYDNLSSTPRRSTETIIMGRSVFLNRVKQRMEEWHRGGPAVSVVLMRVDQYSQLVSRFGAQTRDFLRNIVGRVLQASSRDLDEHCEYDDETFAILIIGSDQMTARRIAERLRTQIGQCNLRLNQELWELSGTIGAAHCREDHSAMGLLQQAEEALDQAAKMGGNMLYVADAV